VNEIQSPADHLFDVLQSIRDGDMAEKNLGNLLRRYRNANSWTQTELGARIQCSAAFICDVENGNRTLSIQKVNTLLELLRNGI